MSGPPAWSWTRVAPPARHSPREGSLAASPGAVAALSFVLPGAGQHVLGQRRKWLYAALELGAWALFVERRHSGGRLRDDYRDLAWEEARVQGSERVDGNFDYYETLTKWTRSGAFDSDPAQGGIQPETDATTFNGSVWDLARRIFVLGAGPVPVDDPSYVAALEYYSGRAYGDRFLWDWSGAGAAQTEFTDLIGESDDRFRQATTALGVVLANHAVSAVDAYLSSRGLSSPVRLRVAPEPGPAVRWSTRVEVPLS